MPNSVGAPMHQRAIIASRHLQSGGVRIAAVAASMLLASIPPAYAQDAEFGNSTPSSRRVVRTSQYSVAKQWRENDDRERRQKGKEAAVPESKPTGPLFAILSISNQHISVYNSSGLVTRSKVSTGMPGHRTPMGIFTIIGRERYHSSTIYSGAPMPFMQRITWSGVAMHLGVVPGYPASHGCIRLPARSAERMWGLTKVGERVVIAPHDVTPSKFAHAHLPVPKLQPSPSTIANNQTPRLTEVASAADDHLSAGSAQLLNPYEYAQVLKDRAAADIGSMTKLQNRGAQREAAVPGDVGKALSELRAAETARSQAEAKLAFRTEALATKRDARDIQRAQTAKEAAESVLAEATKKLEAALENPAFATSEGHAVLEAQRNAMALRSALAKIQAAAKEAERRLSPVSILVSKKDNKVYVRQALAPVFEGPINIRDRDAPLGTHVYIATSHADGSSLGWTAISYPTSRKKVDDTRSRGYRGAGEQAKSDIEEGAPDPAKALERIEFPAEVSALISERLWTGGSLIITDESLSDETSDVGTDLVVTMR
jgi:lipoprotein-anchoring transpeptidase ErfK/SrfK